jgi:hypothetical protein
MHAIRQTRISGVGDPWLNNVSDDYDELPFGDHEVPYDG